MDTNSPLIVLFMKTSSGSSYMEDEMQLHIHLLPPLPTSTPSPTPIRTPHDSIDILIRFSFLLLLLLLSLFAAHEASKGFAVTILNESANKRFHLLYVSNDEAIRLVFKATEFVENFLYPPLTPATQKKNVSHVILKLSSQNLTDDVVVDSGSSNHEFVVNLSPSIMESKNLEHAMSAAVRKGMARVWLWDGQGKAPRNLINGIVEYMMMVIDKNSDDPPSIGATMDTRMVSNLIGYCELRQPGFIRRLNQAMRDVWDDGLLGETVEHVCGSLRYNLSSV